MERMLSAATILVLLAAMAPAADTAPAVVDVSDAQISQFEGTWMGHENPSPFGPISFVMDFQWEEDGSLHSHSAMSKKTWVDLRFRKDANDAWVLDESAALAEMGVQRYRLHPVRAAGDTLEWAYLDRPSYLTVRTAVQNDVLHMLVLLRGERHVEFRLPRITGEQAVAVRTQMKQNSARSGEDDVELLQEAGAAGDDSDDPVEIRNARARVKHAPGDAAAHLALARSLSAMIETAPPARIPTYAFEMLGGFRKAAALEPTSIEAHFGLAQYYLNAPPIAGGSLNDAAQEAVVLGELQSPLADVVLAQIEIKQGRIEPALQRIRKVVDQNPDLEIARQIHASLARTEN